MTSHSRLGGRGTSQVWQIHCEARGQLLHYTAAILDLCSTKNPIRKGIELGPAPVAAVSVGSLAPYFYLDRADDLTEIA